MTTARKPRFRVLLAALLAGAALGAPLVPASAVSDFQLPPSGSSPQPQGPVEPGQAPPRGATPTPAPAPTVAPAEPDPAPTVVVPPVTGASPTPRPAPGAAPAARPAPAGTDAPAAAASDAPAETSGPLPDIRPTVAPAGEAAPVPTAGDTAAGWWLWALGGLAVLLALGGGIFLGMRLRRAEPKPVAVVIERPKVPAAPAAEAAPPPPAVPEAPQDESAPHDPLTIAVEARALTISLSAATLAYRITLTNTGETPLGGVTIAGDMISAHASLSTEDQLATYESPLEQQHEIERIKPGETVQVTGDFRLPFQAIRPIRKGKAAMFVPLARLKVETAEGGNGALIRTALVGQRSARPGGGLQPFRLDLGPRIYREVTQKIFS